MNQQTVDPDVCRHPRHRSANRCRAQSALTVVVVLLCAYAAAAQSNAAGGPTVSPDEVGMSAERIVRVRTMLQRAVANDEVAGVVGLISRRGEIVFHEAFGLRDIETQANMRTDSMFRIASMTKAIVTAAAMILYEEGAFELSDPVARFIPVLRDGGKRRFGGRPPGDSPQANPHPSPDEPHIGPAVSVLHR